MNNKLWENNFDSVSTEEEKPQRSLFDNIGDAITAIGANFNEVRGSERLGDLRRELEDRTLSPEEFEAKAAEYDREYAERQAARDTYKQAQKNLVADDSFLKNVTQMGGTLEGMAAQGIGTAVGAGLGLVGGVGGAAMGAKIGNAAGAVAGGYLDARSVALQAEEDVLNNGGTWEQAKRAYDETLKKASLTTLPETLVDIAMGNRLVGSALNSRAARKIAGSTLGRMGSSVLDPAAKIGTQAAFKSGRTLVGRGAGILADTALQGSTEAVQEVTQDYIGNREVAKAMGKTDNEYSLGGFKDFALSDQGLETMKTAGIMGALFGGVGGTLSSGQYLTRGAETNTGIRAHNNTEKMINDGTLKIDKERRQDEEKIISALTGISPTELATWSDADIIAEASILEGQYMGVTGEAEDMATTRGAADVVRRLTSKEDNTIHREGDVTETSRAFLKGMGVDDKMLEGMFNSPVEKSLMEKARKAEEQAAKQEKTGEKQQTTARLTSDTAESMRENEGKSAIENIKEEAQQNKAETTTENTPSNNLGSAAKQQEQQGKIDTSDNIEYKDSLPGDWEADTQEFEKDAMLDQQSYRNTNTNKKAVIARATDGGFNVVTDLNEERGDTPHFDTLEAAENYLTGKQNDINFQESNGEQTKEGTTEDPNIVPEGGVDARGNSHSGELINSVDDLFNFMQQNPGIIGRGEFIEFVHAKHNLGVNDLSMYIDRKNEGRVYNEQTGQWGYVNAKKFHDEATGRAMIQLYRGGDIISAVHEIAHVGYENLSVQDKATFNRYAVRSMGQWIADMLDVNYDDALRQRLHNLQNDEELRKKIEDSPALRQTVIAFLNAEQNGVDLNHLTADQIRAIDERWAWEFSMWYTEGYMRGVEPQNILQRIYQRGIFSLVRELNMLNRLWEHIHHKDNQDIENLYTGRRNQTEEQVAQEDEIINPFEAPPVTPQQTTQQAAPIVTPVEQTVQQQAPVTPPVEQAQVPVPQEQPQVVQAQTQTEPVQEKPKNNKRQKQPKQPKEPQMTEQELNEQKWRVETGKFLKQFEGARPKQIEQSDADRLNGIINQIKEHPELDKSQGISKRISSILKKFFDQNAQPAQQEQTQEQVQEKPQAAEQTTPVTETPSIQQPEQAPQPQEEKPKKKFKTPTNKDDAIKLLKIVENREEGWKEALDALRKVNPKKLRSVKVQDGNDLWNEQAQPQSGDDLWDTPVEKPKQKQNTQAEKTTENKPAEKPQGKPVVEQAPVETQEQNTPVEKQQGASEEVMEDLYNMSPVDEFDTEEDAIKAIENDNRLNEEQKKDVIDFIKDEFEQYRKIQQKKEGLKQESETKKEKPLTTDEIYSHLYFGNKSGKLKFNKDTKKIEYFEFQNGKMVNRGEITQDQYNELRTRYEKDFKAVKGEKKSFVPDLVEGMKKDDFMYAAFKNVTGSEKEETGEGIELGKDRDVVKDKGDEYSRTNTLENQLSNIGDVENISNLEETELTKEQKEEAKQQEKELKQEDKEKKQEQKKEQPKTTKNTTNKKKDTDPLAELHKKYKNITGTPIGEKGYRFKDDEKQFITAFKQNIDRAVGNKEELLKVSKQLDGWFQNNPTERNRMVRKYLSNYLVDAGQIKVDDGVRNQESNRAEQAQEILDKSFPNTRFQYAWHSTSHDFDKFTLDHLLSGEGAMAHGWGLYFGLDVSKNKKYYFNRFRNENLYMGIANDKFYYKGKDITKTVEKLFKNIFNDNAPSFLTQYGFSRNGVPKKQLSTDVYREQLLRNLKQKINSEKRQVDMLKQLLKFADKPGFIQDAFGSFDEIKTTINNHETVISSCNHLENLINSDSFIIGFGEKTQTNFIQVDIPDDDVLLKERTGFEDQPPKVQRALMKLVRTEGLLNGEEETLSDEDLMEHFDDILGVDINEYDGDIYGTLSWLLENHLYGITDEDITDQVTERCSKLLNEYGIKGIRYDGRRDGECAVIFDDTAIDIITKFRKEEGKWKPEKVDNARNREVDKQKAQRKLEKRRQQDNGTRFMFGAKGAKKESNFSQTIKENEEHEKRMLENRFPGVRFQLAGHASRSDFDVFSLEHFGEGEGESVAGYGIYLAKRWRTIKNYYNLLRGNFAEVTINGKKTEIPLRYMYEEMKNIDFKDKTLSNEDIYELLSESLIYSESIYKKPIASKEIVDVLKERIKDEVSIYNQLNYLPATNPEKLERMKYIRQLNQFIRKIQDRELDINFNIKETGNATIYFVDAPNDDVLIHGSKPLKEQPIIVQNGIKKAFVEAREETIKALKQDKESTNNDKKRYVKEITKMSEIDNDKMQNMPGDVLYEFLQSILSYNRKYVKRDEQGRVYNSESEMLQKKATSEILNKYGIEGISYYGTDTGSGVNNYEDKECLCIFNTKSLKILDKIKRQDGKLKSVLNKKKDDGTRFMIGAKGAKNQIFLTNETEKQFEKNFRTHMKLRGFSDKFIDDYFSNNTAGEGREQIIDNDKLQQKSLFNKTFIDVFNEYNNMMSRKAGVKRGLDGRWRFEFSDKNSSFDKSVLSDRVLDSIPNLPKKNGNVAKMSARLEDVFDHKLLYKYYPHLKDLKISLCDGAAFRAMGLPSSTEGFSTTDEIVINTDYIKKEKTIKSRETAIRQTILHEIQHQIQDYEGLASGAGITAYERKIRINKLVKAYVNKLGGEQQAGRKILEAINDVIKNIKKVPRNQRGDLYKKIRNNSEFFNDTEQNFVLKNPRGIIEGYINNYQDENKKYGRYFDNEVKEMCEYLSLSKSLGLNRDLLRPLEQYQKLYWTTLGEIEARQTEQRFNMSDEERLNRTDILDEGMKNLPILQDAPVVIKDTTENVIGNDDDVLYQESNKKQDKKQTKKQQKKAEIKKQINEARENGEVTDPYKDAYSVSFTESAQENAVNKKKMEYLDRSDYWERSEDNGKVTYTRKTPFEHHQKVITYNGVNDRLVKERPVGKIKKKYREYMDYIKEKITKNLFNDQYALYKLATDLGLGNAYMEMIVTQGYAHKAGLALEKGIMYNGVRTRGMNEIAREIGEEKQDKFLEYIIAKHLNDIYNRKNNKIEQKLDKSDVERIINEVENSSDYELFERCRKDFVQYNHALLHVLVDGGIYTEQEFQKLVERDKNFVPLSKVMDDEDFGYNSIQYARGIVNVDSPIRKLGSSKREIKNPFAEMQKRTALYYALASRNKAGQIFVNKICGNLDKTYEGDTIARGSSVIRRVKVKEEDGKLITRPDDKKQIIYINNGGKHEFYQVADREIYRALKHLDEEQLHIINGMLEKILSAPAGLIRATATSTPDFGLRNIIRDNLTAFYTSENGFLPIIDALWGMREIKRNGEFYQRYIEQVGDYGLQGRGDLLKNGVYKPRDYREGMRKEVKKQFDILTDNKYSLADRTKALVRMLISAPLFAAGDSLSTFNMYLEQGTRVGEFKNAKMGYNGLVDRIMKDQLSLNPDIKKAKQSDIISAYRAQDVTLYFSQHGLLGGKFNRYITFLNASLLGAQKFINTIDLMATGKNNMNQENQRLRKELLFKVVLSTAFAIGLSAAGHGDEDYDEAPDYEKDTFWIFPNGIRIPKDEVFGRSIGTAVQRAYDQYKKEGKVDVLKTLESIAQMFKPNTVMPAILDIMYGGIYNKDSFTGREIVPEYMAHKVGYQQKDIYTGNLAADLTEVLYKAFGINLSAKRIDWALQKNLTNAKKYLDAVYDLKEKYTEPETFNEKMARGYDKNDSTGKFVGGLRDNVPPVLNLITGTFATNRSQYQSINDFNEKYKKIKQIADNDSDIPMTREQKREWQRYQSAYKQYTKLRKELKAIRANNKLSGSQKRERAERIFKKQIQLAKWAEG